MASIYRVLPLMMAFLLTTQAHAQKPVYRCETGGKVSYSNEPCLGAKEIDTTPTQGMDRTSGQSRKGADVQRHELDGVMAEALKPLTGMTPDQYRVQRRRVQLSPRDKMECSRLDATLPELKQLTATGLPRERAAADVELYKARKRFNDLNC